MVEIFMAYLCFRLSYHFITFIVEDTEEEKISKIEYESMGDAIINLITQLCAVGLIGKNIVMLFT